jgi:hypothetical protein
MEEVAQTGRNLTTLADSILEEYAEELGVITDVEAYLTAITESTAQNTLDLKLQQIKLLTGQSFEAK